MEQLNVNDGKGKTICQCNKCYKVFEYSKKTKDVKTCGVNAYRCPHCEGVFRVIKFKNPSDGDYLDNFLCVNDDAKYYTY